MAAEHVEEDRSQEDAEERDAQHAAEDGQAERPPHLGSGTGRQDQGDHAQDEGERRHQDGPEPLPRPLHGRLAPRHAGLLPLLGYLVEVGRSLVGDKSREFRLRYIDNAIHILESLEHDHPSWGVRLGAARAEWFKLERGEREPAWGTVLALMDALGVSCQAFLEEPGPQPEAKPGRPRKADAGPAEDTGCKINWPA